LKQELEASSVQIASQRLFLQPFIAGDADEIFDCITPSITRFMAWEPPPSRDAFARVWRSWLPSIEDGSDLHFVVRLAADGRCLGIVGLHRARTDTPELGIWLREDAHGQGLGREALQAVAAWASATLHPSHFEYPVAAENLASRRVAESLGGTIVAWRSTPKYALAVYRIPRCMRGGHL
jgi:RimJ/RimL family protein N-acetyltransferase